MKSEAINTLHPSVFFTMLLLSANHCWADEEATCGQLQLSNLAYVASGEAAHEGDWPWHAAVFTRNSKAEKYHCGGTIISRNFILTAGYSTSYFQSIIVPEKFLVKLGLYNKSDPYEYTVTYGIVEVIRHVDFDTKYLNNDIALLRTEDDIMYTEYIQPICLWPQEKSNLTDVISSSGYVVGWGLGEDDKPLDILQYAKLAVVDHTTCLKSKPMHFLKFLSENNSNYCAGNRNKTNVCKGDSGGGMYFRLGNAWYIRGLVSTGYRNEPDDGCNPQQFVIFTNIPFYLKWIHDHQQMVKKRNLLDLGNCGLDENNVNTNEIDKPVFLQYPWVAMLESKGDLPTTIRTFCLGALIHPQFIVTVGHCVFSGLKNLSVRLGEYNQKTNPDVGKGFNGKEVSTNIQSIDVEKVFRHPEFIEPRYDNNIALLKLKFPADIDRPNVKPICIPTLEDYNEEYVVSGWKRIGRDAHIMTRESVLVEDAGACREVYKKFNVHTSVNHICGTYYQEQMQQCSHFVSGAAMQYVKRVDRKSRYFLKGLFTFGFPGCKPNYTDVFMSINKYTDWISYIVNQET